MVHEMHPAGLFSEIAAIIFLNSPTPILRVNTDFYIPVKCRIWPIFNPPDDTMFHWIVNECNPYEFHNPACPEFDVPKIDVAIPLIRCVYVSIRSANCRISIFGNILIHGV